MTPPKDIPDLLSRLEASVFSEFAIHTIRENGNPTDVSPGLLSQLAPGVLANLAQCHVIPYDLGHAASHAAAIGIGKLSPALGGAWILQSLIDGSVEDPGAWAHARSLPDAFADSVRRYESIEKKGILGLIVLPLHVERALPRWLHAFDLPTPQWLRAFDPPTPSKRVCNYARERA